MTLLHQTTTLAKLHADKEKTLKSVALHQLLETTLTHRLSLSSALLLSRQRAQDNHWYEDIFRASPIQISLRYSSHDKSSWTRTIEDRRLPTAQIAHLFLESMPRKCTDLIRKNVRHGWHHNKFFQLFHQLTWRRRFSVVFVVQCRSRTWSDWWLSNFFQTIR